MLTIFWYIFRFGPGRPRSPKEQVYDCKPICVLIAFRKYAIHGCLRVEQVILFYRHIRRDLAPQSTNIFDCWTTIFETEYSYQHVHDGREKNELPIYYLNNNQTGFIIQIMLFGTYYLNSTMSYSRFRWLEYANLVFIIQILNPGVYYLKIV